MLPPVVCTTCGMPVGDVAFLYARMVPPAAKGPGFFRPADGGPGALEAGPGAEAAGAGPSPQEVCERLGIHDYCCRMHLVTAMRFPDYY